MDKERIYKIKIITCYIGKLPNYFLLWLRSCEKNPGIDFMVVTDQTIPEWYPSNVSFLITNMKELSERFQKYLDFKIALNNPYKLCDFRPLFGLAFQEELYGYDFWGHCDIDLIWGDMEYFITNELLQSYDKIFNWGHLSLYRNNDLMNTAFKLKGGICSYREVFKNDENYAFDEITGMKRIMEKNLIPMYDETKCANISRKYYRMRLVENGIFNNFNNQVFYWENGKIYRAYVENDIVNRDEFLYIHFQWKNPACLFTNTEDLESFYIFSDCFKEKKNGILSKKEIEEFSNYKGVKYEKKENSEYRMRIFRKFLSENRKQKIIWLKQKFR